MNSVRSDDYQKLLEELVKARKNAGLTQQSLAAKMGKPQSFISKVENGERRLDVIEFVVLTRMIGTNYKKIIDSCL